MISDSRYFARRTMITVSILRRFFLISRRIFFDARSIVHGPSIFDRTKKPKKEEKKNIKKRGRRNLISPNSVDGFATRSLTNVKERIIFSRVIISLHELGTIIEADILEKHIRWHIWLGYELINLSSAPITSKLVYLFDVWIVERKVCRLIVLIIRDVSIS